MKINLKKEKIYFDFIFAINNKYNIELKINEIKNFLIDKYKIKISASIPIINIILIK